MSSYSDMGLKILQFQLSVSFCWQQNLSLTLKVRFKNSWRDEAFETFLSERKIPTC